MKTFLTASAFALLTATSLSAGEQQVRIGVSEMTCPSCSFTVSRSMRSVPSVEIYDVIEGQVFGEGVFIVNYDDELATADMIVDAVWAIGYPAEIVEDGSS